MSSHYSSSTVNKVTLKKKKVDEQYGIKFGTQLIIQNIQPGSLAAKYPDVLKSGTVILAINGVRVDNFSPSAALDIVKQNSSRLELLIKKVDGKLSDVTIPL